jgi:hypothetical protein
MSDVFFALAVVGGFVAFGGVFAISRARLRGEGVRDGLADLGKLVGMRTAYAAAMAVSGVLIYLFGYGTGVVAAEGR